MTGKILDPGLASEISGVLIDVLLDAGYSDEEIIPGLIMSIQLLCRATARPEQALDEAFEMLSREEEE